MTRDEALRERLIGQFSAASGLNGPAIARGIDAILAQEFMDEVIVGYLSRVPGPFSGLQPDNFLQVIAGSSGVQIDGRRTDSRGLAGVLNLLLADAIAARVREGVKAAGAAPPPPPNHEDPGTQ